MSDLTMTIDIAEVEQLDPAWDVTPTRLAVRVSEERAAGPSPDTRAGPERGGAAPGVGSRRGAGVADGGEDDESTTFIVDRRSLLSRIEAMAEPPLGEPQPEASIRTPASVSGTFASGDALPREVDPNELPSPGPFPPPKATAVPRAPGHRVAGDDSGFLDSAESSVPGLRGALLLVVLMLVAAAALAAYLFSKPDRPRAPQPADVRPVSGWL